MASKTRTFPVQAPVPGRLTPPRSFSDRIPERNATKVLSPEIASRFTIDFVLYHNAADGIWSSELAERIRGQRSGNRNFVVQPASWNFSSPTDILAETEKCLVASRLFGVVVTKRLFQEDWPALEKLISDLSDFGLAKGRFVTILKENVTMPPVLRQQDWIDFRDGHRQDESVCDLLTLLREGLPALELSSRLTIGTGPSEPVRAAWQTKPIFAGVKKTRERIVSNLFPVAELPREIFSAETRFQTESEIMDACGGPGPLPFLLKGSRIYAVAPVTEHSVFTPALIENAAPSRELFTQWLSDQERAPRAIELLNRLLRYHAWKRGMRFDEGQSLFYFTRSKPKKLWWEIGGKTIQREVTAPHTKWDQIENQTMAEFQCGWRHEALRAGFVQVLGALFLRLEPAWFLTELDGKTPSTTQRVGPLEPLSQYQEKNGQVLRTLRFWSAVLAKGHRELRMECGGNPIRVRLTPASASSGSIISNDQMDFDSLALADLDDVQLIPELGPVEP